MIKEVTKIRSEESNPIKSAFQYLEQNRGSLTENTFHFIQSLKKFYSRNKTLSESERQQNALLEIKRYIIHNPSESAK